ncbi:S-layer homology domain-containing protein [Bengtsoniella intestinalis]|uniref:S-layer homology domain-containing protein n=1 Tax=Bengtsoniella intestinalis TaxID=3073143 RepID=UPI00391F18CE
MVSRVHYIANEQYDIQLTSDITENVVIEDGKTVTIDLNGKTLSNSSSHTIENSGTLTIKDTVGGGIVTVGTSSKAALKNTATGVADVKAGTYTRTGNPYYVIQNLGEMTLGTAVTAYSEVSSAGSSALVTNGYYYTADGQNAATPNMIINGGTYTNGGEAIVIKNDEYGVLEINGGTFTGHNALQNWNIATINDGEFIAGNSSGTPLGAIYNGSWDTATDVGQLTINGGSFTGEIITGNYMKGGDTIVTFGDDVTIESTASLLVYGGQVYIEDGVTVTIEDGATLTNAGEIYLGTNAAAATQASFTALDDGTLVASAIAYNSEPASLVIEEGATVTNTESIDLSNGTLTVGENATFTNEGTIDATNTTITIGSGGAIVNDGTLILDDSYDSTSIAELGMTGTGTVTVDGDSTAYDSYGNPIVSTKAELLAAIAADATLITIDGDIVLDEAAIIDSGVELVIPADSSLTITSDGSLTITSNGAYSITGEGDIKNYGTITTDYVTGIAGLIVDGGTLESFADSTIIITIIDTTNLYESGEIVGENGLKITSGSVTIGLSGAVGDSGTPATDLASVGYAITLTEDSVASIEGDFQDGDYNGFRIAGKDVFTVEDGATLTIAYDTEVSGTLTIEDGGEVIVNETVTLDIFDTGSGYEGELTIEAGATLTVNGVLTKDAAATITNDGTILVYDEDGLEAAIEIGGNIKVNGDFTIENDVTISSGKLTIASGVTLTVDTDATLTIDGTAVLIKNGTIDGDGTVVNDMAWYNGNSSPYYISTAEELAYLAELVNDGTDDFDGDIVYLTAAIDLSDYDNWTPIGDYDESKPFSGTFDGGEFEISNLTITGTADAVGLFGYTDGAMILEVTIVSGSVAGDQSVGGIVGYACDSNIVDCINYADITGDYEVGGIVGCISGGDYGDTVSGSTNYGKVTGDYCVGGITGSAEDGAIVSDCVNNGTVTGTSDYVGGIAGDSDNRISNSTNTGDVTGVDYVGGIVGYADAVEIAGCINTGDVDGADYVGGILGYISAYIYNSDATENALFYNCYTGGDVTGTGENVAAVYGFASSDGDDTYYYYDYIDVTMGYIITFDADGGEYVYTAAVAADDDTITLTDATRSGYTFDGWLVDGEGDYVTDATVYEADTTLVADWTKNSSSSGGTSSYTSSVSSSSNGDVSISSSKASSGTKITITTEPDDGYEVGTVTVTYSSGKEVTVTDNGDGTYSYLQPGAAVTVKVTFVSEDGEEETEEETVDASGFSDVDGDAYYYEAMLWAVENGITTGYTDGTFRATTSCTRAQVVTFLWRAAGEPEASIDNPFSDLDEDAYYYEAVLWAVENGITAGYTDGTFGADDTCTRGQIVTFMFRMDGEEAVDGDAMPDVDEDTYCYDSVMWAVENGITTGYTDGTFGPNDLCNRGQIVTFLYRYLG